MSPRLPTICLLGFMSLATQNTLTDTDPQYRPGFWSLELDWLLTPTTLTPTYTQCLSHSLLPRTRQESTQRASGARWWVSCSLHQVQGASLLALVPTEAQKLRKARDLAGSQERGVTCGPEHPGILGHLPGWLHWAQHCEPSRKLPRARHRAGARTRAPVTSSVALNPDCCF